MVSWRSRCPKSRRRNRSVIRADRSVMLEAMIAGKPIVAARAAAIPDLVRHGILVEPGDLEGLAHGILRLYSGTLRTVHSRTKLMTLDAVEFLRRFLLHIL